jgi:pimeloyl-ACP methyl ester carboxylesterase
MKSTALRLAAAIRGVPALALLLALVLALGVVVTTGAGAADATSTASAGERPRGPKPTIVLVHGGWADSSGWNAEVSALQKKGYPVIAPANPLRGLTSDAAYIRSVVDTIDGPVVLVGHSYGGAVITNAAVGAKNVQALVYIAAFAPDQGDTLAALVTKNPGTYITPDALQERPYPLPEGGTGTDLYIKAADFHDAFAGDLPERTTELMQATQRPFSVAAFTEASGAPAWKTLPSWYLVSTQDHAIPPATQRFMAARAHARTVEVAASHVPMISQPEVTTRLILQAATSVTDHPSHR